MNIPNFLTLIRLLIVPIFGYMMYIESYFSAAILFIVAWLTDILDGFIARKFNMVTDTGKVVDPLADKLIIVTALVFLFIKDRIHIAALLIVVAKELLMGLGGILLYKNKKKVSGANWYGKVASAFIYFAIVMSIMDWKYSDLFIVIAVVSTLFALLMYIRKYLMLSKDSEES